MPLRLLAGTLAALTLTASAALAQSYNAPAGIPAATAPGGLEGRAADPNIREAVESRGVRIAPRDTYERDIATGSVRARGDARR